ncbi:DUF3809 domain-containing protein [Deinococcus sp.]|uniref:DUF3809 domain-containing protein n=1 Tax=Deinococcus sp. TaxID=47478 RepID=UPI0025F60CD9|nr:DUF3809 domain-containing protein [Deinococcus sp.]
MIVEAHEDFSAPTALAPEFALAFLRDPTRLLSRVSFLREVEVSGQEVRGVLAVQLPLLGEVSLPFFSVLENTERGARLTPQPIEHRRAWLEVGGEGRLDAELDAAALAYAFVFRAHLDTPTAEKWGGAAFEKMVQAAASRTIARVAQALPRALAEALAVKAG